MPTTTPAKDPVQSGADGYGTGAGSLIETAVLQLHAEEIAISKRRVPGELVRVTTQTNTRDVVVDEPLSHETVVVERVPIGRYVDAAPEIRYVGDVTIMPVIDEELVVTRRLFLREEVHVRRERTTTPHVETVTLREQQVVLTRESPQPSGPPQLRGAGTEFAPTSSTRSMPMESETIVAVYDTAAHAELAANDLRQAGVPDSAITLHSTASTTATTTGQPLQEKGFWSSLFGGDTAEDSTVYDRGGTRIRRYVVETPVEEIGSLHSETVKLERNPVTDGRPVTDASFSEKTIEMMESAEEAVVSKTARVVEEVGLRKEATDRVETIRDTVRKEAVDIEQIPGTTTTTTTTPGTFSTPKV